MSHCFNCGYTAFEDGREPIKQQPGPIKIIREYYHGMTQYYHSCVNSVARNYLNKRGITDQMIDQFKIGYCPHDINFMYNGDEAKVAGLVNEQNRPTLAGRVVFPYMFRGVVYDLRGRAIDDDPVRYKSPHGSKVFRGAEYPFNADDMVNSHILVEGEIKALILKKHGLNAVGLPGITLKYDGYRPSTYYICFDSEPNEQTRKDVLHAIHRASLWGFDPYIITLPRSTEKIGADDYINRYGIDSFLLYYRKSVPYDTWKKMIR